jgi:hypothetical protein
VQSDVSASRAKVHWPAVIILGAAVLLSAATPIVLALWCGSCSTCR